MLCNSELTLPIELYGPAQKEPKISGTCPLVLTSYPLKKNPNCINIAQQKESINMKIEVYYLTFLF